MVHRWFSAHYFPPGASTRNTSYDCSHFGRLCMGFNKSHGQGNCTSACRIGGIMCSRIIVCVMLLMVGCATHPPTSARLELQLAPAELGVSIALQQHLTVERNGKTDELDAALEIDNTH